MSRSFATLNAEETPAVLGAVLRNVHGAHARLEEWTAVPLTKRGKHRTVRFDLSVRANGETHAGPQQWVGKFYESDDAARRVATALRNLAATDCGARGLMVIPRVLDYYPPRLLLVLSYETGQSVVKATAQDPAAVLSAMGRALAALHTTPVTVEGTTSAAGVLNGLHQKIADLSARFPGHRDFLRQMLNLLERRAPWLAAPAFLHGDLGPSQLLWQQGRIVMLDFDRCTRGDPASDLGRLLAQLRRLTLRKPGKLPDFAVLRNGILEGYQRWTPPDAALTERVTWYEQVTLLQKIHFLVFDTTRHSEAEAMQLRQAEATCLLGALAPLVKLNEPPPVVARAAHM